MQLRNAKSALRFDAAQKAAQLKNLHHRDTGEAGRASQPRSGLPRSFDVLASLIGLLLSAPLLLVSAFTVALTSRGGVLFRQKRVGKDGDTFTLYKLRTMRVSNGGPQVTTAGDARITRPGRFLRSTKIDELPTLWNVLRGDMAFVGPRPEVPRYVKLDDPIWQAVLAARPGITDPVTLELRDEEGLLAQVNGDAEKYYVEELQPLKLKGYVAYLETRNWRSDLNVLLRTVAAVVIPQRTSG
jgi:lipopolysaccharide/colanic/teichoic acid biosynthesis glycosyltransferase